MPKDIPPPPFTPEEIQEKIRSGELKVEFAETHLIQHYAPQIRLILVAIGKHHADDGAEEWADTCMVSDMSTMSDFNLDEQELMLISKDLGGVIVRDDDYLYAVAARMAGAN